MRVKIRGIYTTALTNILLEKGYKIVQPSVQVTRRFGIENNEEADLYIHDTEESDGIVISGKNSEKLAEDLKPEFRDSIFRKYDIGAVYIGIVKKIDKINKRAIVDLGNLEGYLSFRDADGYVNEGDKVLVQVKSKNKEIYLSTKLRIFGENAVLIENGFDKVTKHIRDLNERARLLAIAQRYKKGNFGILWKSGSENKDEEELAKEIENLMNEREKIIKEFEEGEGPKLLREGQVFCTIIFGKESKEYLDKKRKEVTPTIKEHHSLKYGGYAYLVDYAERLMDDVPEEKLLEKLKESIFTNARKVYFLKHKKPDGDEIVIRGYVIERSPEEVIIRRNLKKGKNYDGLNIPIEEGDYALSKIKAGNWYVIHEYYDKNDNLKGKYISINTPIELFPEKAVYIDLEIDVIEKEGRRYIIDKEELEKAYEEGLINDYLKNKALEIAEELVKGE